MAEGPAPPGALPRRAPLRSWLAGALIAAGVAWATLAVYGGIPRHFNPWFGAEGDERHFALMGEGLSWRVVHDPAQPGRLVPAAHLTFFALRGLFSGHWRPHAYAALAGHGLLAAVVGLSVMAVGRSFFAGVAVATVVVTSVPMASGLRYSFAAALHTPTTALIVAAAFLLFLAVRRDSPAATGGVLVAATLAVFADPRGVLTFPVLVLFGVAARCAADPGAAARQARRATAGLGILAWVYAALWVTGIWWWGDPGQHLLRELRAYADAAPVSSLGELLAYSSYAWWSPPPLDELPNRLPRFVAMRARLLCGALALLAAFFAFAARLGSRRRQPALTDAGWAGLAAVLAAALLGWEGIRYGAAPISFVRVHGGATAFLAAAVGLGLAAVLTMLHRPARAIAVAVMLAAASHAALANVAYLRQHRLDHVDAR